MKELIAMLLALATIAATVFAVTEVANAKSYPNAKSYQGRTAVSAKCPRCP